MKTYTKIVLMAAMFLFGSLAQAWAQNLLDEEGVTVTFRVNTATVSDTLDGGVIQIRGNINGEEFDDYFGQVVNWSETSHQGAHVDGDYWEIPFTMAPGDVLTYKFWVGHDLENGAVNQDQEGWETGDDKTFTMPEDATEDFETDVIYFNRVAPFEPEDGKTTVFFRVNVGHRVALGDFDPDNEDHRVGIRGLPEMFDNPADWGSTEIYLEKEPHIPNSANYFYSGVVRVDNDILDELPDVIPYKFVLEAGSTVYWDDKPGNPDGNRLLDRPTEDVDETVRWVFFQEARPPLGTIVDASLTFNVNVSLLEDLGFFNRSLGDRVATRGSFDDWSSPVQMNYNEAADVWTTTIDLTEEVGAEIRFKYFIDWDESRFDEESPNYIPNLDPDNGWEEPGTFGGGDRIYEFGDTESQIASGDFGGEVAFFNSLPAQAIITSAGVGAETLPVTFLVDMTPALDHTEPFDPENDELFLIVQTPIFALTQGLTTGTEALDFPEQRDKLRFSPADGDNMYELTLDLALPTENHFGFVLAYEKPDGELVQNGEGYDAGRRYYRYVTPEAVIGEDVLWPMEYTLALVEWKAEDLDFETPPDYGIANSVPGEGNQVPNQVKLSQNYPNPFNPTTNINFSIPEGMDIRLDVYNILGQRVATLARGFHSAGTYTVQFDAGRLASGVYLYRLQAGSFSTQKTMMLVK